MYVHVLLSSRMLITSGILAGVPPTDQRLRAFKLQKKISVREELEYISKKYIRESIELVRKKSVSDRDFENEKIKLHL